MDASTLSVGVTVATANDLTTANADQTATNATFHVATATTKSKFVVDADASPTVIQIGALGDISSTVATKAGAAADLVSKINDASNYQAAGISAAIKSGTTDTIELTQNTTKSHVMSADAARQSITNIDAAMLTVSTQRSELGAISNRLTHTVSNMTNISTNLSAARGGIEDADFALETTNLAKNQILQQASTAMLAQANASKQNVLSLLRG
jgi:flagellin